MSDYLNRNEFVPYAPTERGEQVHVHHCKQGQHNDRLYIRRTEDDTILAYCHHCGKRGSARTSFVETGYSRDEISSRLANCSADGKSNHSSGYEGFKEYWECCRASDKDVEQIASESFILKSRLKRERIEELDVRVRDNRIWFPVPSDEEGELAAIVGRGESPKWLVRRNQNKKVGVWGTGKSLVIVEDIISAIRVSDCGYSAMPLLSSTLQSKYLTDFSKYDNIYIWLDNDNHQVLSSRLKIKHKLDLLYNNVIIIPATQPKDLSNSEIKKEIDDASYRYASKKP